MTLPYAHATAGETARKEIMKILRNFGCQSVGFMDDFEGRTVLLAFRHRGRDVQLKASAAGWANAYLKENPWSTNRRSQRHEYEEKAFEQGMVAVNSILRDWVNGQVTAIETGILSFDHVFMPYMLIPDGRTVAQHLDEHNLLPKPEEAT